MEGHNVGMTLTELQDRDLAAGVVPERTISHEKQPSASDYPRNGSTNCAYTQPSVH